MELRADTLGPNGLPYARCPPARNEWAGRSKVLKRLPADPVATMHPSIVARQREDVGGGMGLFCCNGIAAGEVVWAEPANAGSQIAAIPRTRAWIEALPPASQKAYCHFMYKTGDDEYQSLAEFNELPIEEFPRVQTVDVSNYMNHSCSPSCWFVDGGEAYTGMMVAVRDLAPGDEVTYDYCTSEDCELSPEWQCECGAAECRKRVTPHDWQRPELQRKYAGHFLPHIAAKVAGGAGAPSGAVCSSTLCRADSNASWWLRQLEGDAAMPATLAAPVTDAPRRALLAPRAVGRALDTLNRQAAVLILHHRLEVCQNELVGGYVRAGRPIAEGELVMLLPPNLLLWDEQVPDFNTCLQIGATANGDRLFSSSITPSDVDNFLCHSCEPNCRFRVGDDLACGLVALRPIQQGEPINFDYDETEDDLRGERGGFECHCGAPGCRRMILGRLYSPPAGGELAQQSSGSASPEAEQ